MKLTEVTGVILLSEFDLEHLDEGVIEGVKKWYKEFLNIRDTYKNGSEEDKRALNGRLREKAMNAVQKMKKLNPGKLMDAYVDLFITTEDREKMFYANFKMAPNDKGECEFAYIYLMVLAASDELFGTEEKEMTRMEKALETIKSVTKIKDWGVGTIPRIWNMILGMMKMKGDVA